MQDRHIWSWPIVGYLFLGGLGGGMIILSSLADLFWGQGAQFALGSLLAGVIIALGSTLLLLDLGKPWQFWRVFSRQKAIITFGAWMIGVLTITSIIYFTFWLSFSPWKDFTTVRQILAWLNSLLGLGLCLYTGIFLGSMKSRPFWNTPLLPILFLISGVSGGIAVQSLLVGSWPYSGPPGTEAAHALLRSIDIGVILLELLVVLVYVLMMRTFVGREARLMANSWLVGEKKLAFWGGLVGLGLLLPVALYLVTGSGINIISACVLVGGLVLRSLVVYSDQRRKLPDEAQ